ncbi:tetraspanin-5 [Astyanax mexicanus]|uniref:Tetraspanin-5 n=3 Tax=Astyanax mexicanus TaxID=7994 RepID=A0A8T2LTJ8_ASTMX|nr:tetraspanin-5 [Astyanax mexicanus]
MMSGKHYKGHEVSCCIKYFIFGFNIIFWLLGVAFLGIGLWAWSEKGVLSNISSITDLGGFDPVWLFLVVGGVMFILGFAGCIGALRENTFLLKFFSVFLGIIFFLELTAGVLAFVFKDWIKDQLNFFINNNIRAYRDDIDLQNLIDFTQEYWECCGAFGADDWNLNIYFNCTDSNPSREKCGVPFSCCTKDPAEDVINTQCGYDVRAKSSDEQRTYIHVKGCVPQFEKWLQDNLTVVAGIFIGIALLQIFGICLAQNLVSDIEAVQASCSPHQFTSPPPRFHQAATPFLRCPPPPIPLQQESALMSEVCAHLLVHLMWQLPIVLSNIYRQNYARTGAPATQQDSTCQVHWMELCVQM